jgi:hypothetical protein
MPDWLITALSVAVGTRQQRPILQKLDLEPSAETLTDDAGSSDPPAKLAGILAQPEPLTKELEP